MDLTSYVDGLRRDLLAAAAAGTEEARRLADLLSAALEPAVRLAIVDALSAAAAEVTDALQGTTVEVRMHGREPRIVVSTAPPEPAASGVDETEGTARITLRLPESLKTRVESAAAGEGVSVNTWLARAVSRALEHPPNPRAGRRLTGYARG
jgi:predicted HicB family RNase H-like nuclease